jgi:TetR/AcrR family transcriptional regulator, cholesterol catabolism regulator
VALKNEKRKKIIEIATNLFAEKGYGNVTTRDIARAVETNNASLYYYFSNKEALLYEILDDTIMTGLQLLSEIEKTDEDPKEKLRRILLVHTQAALDYNKMKLLVHNQESLSREHSEMLDIKQKSYIRILIKVLDDIKKAGGSIDIDTTVCAFAFFGMVSWAYRWYNPEGRIKTDELSEIFHRLFTSGLFLQKDNKKIS